MASAVDVATFEFENIPFTCAEFIAKQVDFMPRAEILKITQNRLLEKNFLKNIKIKTTDFVEIKNLQDLQENLFKFKKANWFLFNSCDYFFKNSS